MRKTLTISVISGISVMLAACSAPDTDSSDINVPIKNSLGAKIGTLMVDQIAGGGVNVQIDISGITPGSHAMHFHEFGRCDGPDFKSAGGHYNPAGVPHGNVEGGSHAGDMMNIEANANGTATFKVTNEKVNIKGGTLPALKDADGTALIIHGGADDYTSQPSGAAGPRVACAVIKAG